MRSAPSKRAAVVGRLYSALDWESHEESKPQKLGPSFKILAVSGDWLLIEKANPITEDPAGPTFRNYQGRGWVHSSRVVPLISGDISYAHPNSASAQVDRRVHFNVVFPPSKPPQVVGCSGRWLQIEYLRYDWYGQDAHWYPVRSRRPVLTRAWVVSQN